MREQLIATKAECERLEAEMARIERINGLFCDHHGIIDGCGIAKAAGRAALAERQRDEARGRAEKTEEKVKELKLFISKISRLEDTMAGSTLYTENCTKKQLISRLEKDWEEIHNLLKECHACMKQEGTKPLGR